MDVGAQQVVLTAYSCVFPVERVVLKLVVAHGPLPHRGRTVDDLPPTG